MLGIWEVIIIEKEMCWLWLATLDGIAAADITELLKSFGSACDIYKEESFKGISGIKPALIAKLKNKSLLAAEDIIKKSEQIGAKIITFESKSYPEALKYINNPPYVFYLRGEVPDWKNRLNIGVVGTRRATEYGIAVTKRICAGLAENGVTVVSGMARGIDTVAANTAIESGGKTVAVLGCSIDRAYPAENAPLMNRIIENGAVISEYPPGAPTRKLNFPMRNRIISGLSRGILVTEAPKKSGALITANIALEDGRDVFAVPGSIFKKSSEGANALLVSSAKAVVSEWDIISEYMREYDFLNKPKKRGKDLSDKKPERADYGSFLLYDTEKYRKLSETEKTVAALLLEGDMHIDDIKRESGIEISELNRILSVMELGGYINKLPGNIYKLNI